MQLFVYLRAVDNWHTVVSTHVQTSRHLQGLQSYLRPSKLVSVQFTRIRIKLTQCNKIAAIKSGHGLVITGWPPGLFVTVN